MPVYESVVRSLYGDLKTLAVGTASMVAAPVVLFLRNNDSVHLWFALLLAALGMLRLIDGVAFHLAARRQSMTRDYLRKWEMRYAVLGAAYVAALGAWCLTGFARTSDEFVHLMSVSITISFLVGIIGRNFSSEIVVVSQTVFAGTPMILGFLLFGDLYHMLLGAFLFPLFTTIWMMSKTLRSILFDSTLRAIDNKVIADRFDVALSNVSHGMAMFDRDGHFVVVNNQFAGLCGLAGRELVPGTPMDVFDDCHAVVDTGMRQSNLRQHLAECLANDKTDRFNFVLESGRIIEGKFNPMSHSGGGVLVLEDISERVSTENEIRKLASFDPLTHLPNRRFFASEVNRVLSSADGLAACTFLFVDLDNFKDVNDTLGHSTGDKLLCSVALRLRAAMPERALVCRFGGDEFVIVAPGKMTRLECVTLAETLIEEIGKVSVIDGHHLSIGASIGIARCPANGRDYNQLLKVSDVALYDAKARGRGCYSFYTDELGDIVRDRRQIENELRRALDRGQLELHFQPLVNLATNRITTCEALVRWRHPDRGMIAPSVFIPIAEEIGIITQIGNFVLEEATRACMKWPKDVSVAVNVSSLQFQQSDLCAVVQAALTKSGLEACRLEVEVTESAMLENVDETTRILRALAKTGVRVSLDDFGTGFSSLSYLHTLPLDKVKIDRAFIENILVDERSLILLSGVTNLAQELGLSITIEGVETENQLQLLREKVKVDEIQGYLFGRAMPEGDIYTMLHNEAAETARRSTA